MKETTLDNSIESKRRRRRALKKTIEKIMNAVFFVCGAAAIAAVALITVYMVVSGLPAIREIGLLDFLFGTEWKSTAAEPKFGILPFILTSIWGTLGAIVIGVPVGLLTAVFLSKVASRRVASVVRPAVELLAGIPSGVYGLIGMMVLVPAVMELFHLKNGTCLFAAILVLAIMILPSIISVSETALNAVPPEYEEASLALGATKIETIFKVSIPAAKSGIVAGIVLGIGRAIGEAMAVMMVAGNVANMPGLFKSVTFLTTAVAKEMSYASGLQKQALFSIALVLFCFIMLINSLLNFFLKKGGETMNGQDRRSGRRRAYDIFFKTVVYLSAFLTVALLVVLIGYIFVRGLPHITGQLLSTAPSVLKDTIGILPNILNTLYIILFTLLIALPLGVGAAVYLTEYASNKTFIRIVEFATETLAGIPSIIYGLVGMLFFAQMLGFQTSLLSGGCTLVIMILPTIIRTTQESLKTVPQSYREGALGLGATKWYMIRTIILPSSVDGIVTGCILSIGRIVGESAALLFTAGVGTVVANNIFSAFTRSGGTLSVALYMYVSERGEFDVGFAIAAILMLLVLCINGAAKLVEKKLRRKTK